MMDSAATFAFADIAGFTALTEAHGDDEALAFVDEFRDTVDTELPAVGGQLVKTIGDALMLRIPDPADAILLGLRIADEMMRDHGVPAVRVGLHYGKALERDDDYFGAAVNLAFIEHFQEVARGHFTVRRLERVYGAEIVRAEYDRLRMAFDAAA